MRIQPGIKLAALLALFLPGLTLADDCNITLSQSVIDYHQLQRDNIVMSQQDWHKMPEREVNVNVYCPDEKQIGVLVEGVAGERPLSVWREGRCCHQNRQRGC